MNMTNSERPFLPAAGHDWFLPLYDPVTRLLGVDTARQALLEQAALQRQHRVLDLGCGTGTLAVLIKRLYPTVDVVGLDPDPRALARAERKAQRAAVSVRFDQGFAGALGYPDATFDRVFSSMMFHHLAEDERPRMLHEIRRVLRPGGRLELLDFAGGQSNGHGMVGRLIHSHHRLKDNTEGRILSLMAQAGLVNAKKVGDRTALFGRIEFYQASAGWMDC
jgi:ubiquinone/menaquinone biosynthesis C-methylase UbiE